MTACATGRKEKGKVEKTKKGLKALDWVLLVLLALLVAGAVWFLKGRSGSEPQLLPMSYTVLLEDMPEQFLDFPQVGDPIYRSDDNVSLGTVEQVQVQPHKQALYSSDLGQYLEVEEEDRWDVYLTIQGQGYGTEQDIVISDVVLKTGNELNVKGKGYAGEGVVVAVEEAFTAADAQQ